MEVLALQDGGGGFRSNPNLILLQLDFFTGNHIRQLDSKNFKAFLNLMINA